MVGRLYGMRRARGQAPRARSCSSASTSTRPPSRPAKTYSGGMRRRLDLAAALVARPPVLFLDEPTTGLDPRSRLELWETIEGLVAEGTTVLLTTQYLDEADRLADRIAVIDRGRVIAEGTPDELKDRVGGERLEVHLADARAVAAAVAGARADVRRARRSSRTATVQLTVRAAHGHDRRGGAPARRGRRRRRRPRRCAARRSTTCSCRSPATRPRRADDRATEEEAA